MQSPLLQGTICDRLPGHVNRNIEEKTCTLERQDITLDSNLAKQKDYVVEKNLMDRLKQINDRFDREQQVIRRIQSFSTRETHASNAVFSPKTMKKNSDGFAPKEIKSDIDLWSESPAGSLQMPQHFIVENVQSIPTYIPSKDHVSSGTESDEFDTLSLLSVEDLHPLTVDDFSGIDAFNIDDTLDLFSVIESL